MALIPNAGRSTVSGVRGDPRAGRQPSPTGWNAPHRKGAPALNRESLGVSILALPPSPASIFVRAGLGLALLALAACAGQERSPAGSAGQLFARGLDEIAELYIDPVSSRRLALSGAMRLARLDNKIGVGDAL